MRSTPARTRKGQDTMNTMGSSMRRGLRLTSIAVIAAALLVVAGTGRADDEDDLPDETLPGFKHNQAYMSSQIDNVNIFSGDIGVVVPLGPSYTLGPGLAWQLKTSYSAKLWSYDTVCSTTISTLFKASHGAINGFPTLGAGWWLDLGNIGPERRGGLTWVYRTPDGGSHTIPFPDPVFPSTIYTPQPGDVYKTNDGSLLRIRYDATGFHVDFPDGSIHHFEHVYTPPLFPGSIDFSEAGYRRIVQGQTLGQRWALSSIEDKFGNLVLRVNHDATSPWKISTVELTPNSNQRFIRFYWTTFSASNYLSTPAVTPSPFPVLDRIEFPASAGQTMTVSFQFENGAFGRGGPELLEGTDCVEPNYPNGVAVPLLDKIVMNGTALEYAFDYARLNLMPWDITSGLLEKIKLPTGAYIKYAYDRTSDTCLLGINCDGDPRSGDGGIVTKRNALLPRGSQPTKSYVYFNNTPAVVSRTESDRNGNFLSQTVYARQDFALWKPVTLSVDERRVTRQVLVTRPDGNGGTYVLDKHLFHVDGGRWPQSAGLELERHHYQSQDASASATPIRSKVFCYHGQNNELGSPACGWAANGSITLYGLSGNVRQQKEVTWYGPWYQWSTGWPSSTPSGDDCLQSSTKCLQSAKSGIYNPDAAEYPFETITSTLTPMIGWTGRVTETIWTPQTVNGAKWLPKLHSDRDIRDSLDTPSSNANYPAPTQVHRSRLYDRNGSGFAISGFVTSDTTSNPNGAETNYGTLVHTFEKDGTYGNLLSDTLSGTDQVVAAQFETIRTYSSNLPGLPRTAQRAGICWKSFDVDRDPATGMITASRDPNGAVLTSSYEYDALGRIKRIAPPGVVETIITYDSPNQTTVTRPGAGPNSPWERYVYDDLGRLDAEVRLVPGVTGYSVRYHEYNDAGMEAFTSEWFECGDATGNCSTQFGTRSLEFDPFGRPRKIRKADGGVTTIDRTDPNGNIPFSDTYETVTQTVNTSEQSVTKTRKDALGRIVSVTEPPAASVVGGPLVADQTEYVYNVLDKVARVLQGEQTRLFEYDAFGFLRRESHPEKTGVTTYGPYDALGNVLAKTDGGTSYVYEYDTAARLKTVTGGGRLYLQNFYDKVTCPSGDNTKPLGRLTSRVAYNPLATPASSVTDVFDYTGATGKLFSKKTSFTNNPLPLPETTQKWFYNSLGLEAAHYHPRSTGVFAVTTQYSYGLPVAVQANGIPVVSSVQYSPAAALVSYTSGNGMGEAVTTTIDQDDSLIPRPASISTSNASPNFATGAYQYDPSGNITRIGNDEFTYDHRSRLKTSTIDGLDGISTGTQNYTQDRYGNLLSNGSTSYTVSTATNRLASGAYDSRGNLTHYGTEDHAFDDLDRQFKLTKPNETWNYLFDGDGERLVKVPQGGANYAYYTLRDPAKRIATEFLGSGPGVPADSRDNVYVGNNIVASAASCATGGSGWQFYTTDHLGTVRFVTDQYANGVDTRKYRPFGDEIGLSGGAPAAQRVAFASMERDHETNAYYDHARSHDFGLGRFLSVDRLSGRVENPQSWDRYAYALNNPLKYVDPDGRDVKYASPAVAIAFKSVISQYPAVQKVFDLYNAPGAPDLNIGTGTPEKDPDGFTPPAALSADISVDPATGYDWEKMNDNSPVLPESGQFLVKAELKSASIVVSPDFLSGNVSGGKASKLFSKAVVHEMGHAKHAITDPVDYAKLRAKDMTTKPDGSPIKHDERKIEKKANDYMDSIVR